MNGNTKAELLGGKSVFCINKVQMTAAHQLLNASTLEANRVKSLLEHVEADLTPNERAALAFLIIDRLHQQPSTH